MGMPTGCLVSFWHSMHRRKESKHRIYAGAEAFVRSSSKVGDINQALVELGSTVCKVRDSSCSDRALCSWYQAYKQVQHLPVNSSSCPVMCSYFHVNRKSKKATTLILKHCAHCANHFKQMTKLGSCLFIQ